MSSLHDEWTFTVTWDPEVGSIPMPVLRLFRYRSEVTPGRAVLRTDRGHGTFYEKAVGDYLATKHPDRSDITFKAEKVEPADA